MRPRPPFLEFRRRPTLARTRRWVVVSRVTGDEVGRIRWYAPGRRYTFQTRPRETILDASCVREVAVFLEFQMRERAAERAGR